MCPRESRFSLAHSIFPSVHSGVRALGLQLGEIRQKGANHLSEDGWSERHPDSVFISLFFSGCLQWVEETQRSEFRFYCSRVFYTSCGGKKKVIRHFGKCLFWASVCLERPITEHEPVLRGAVVAKSGLWA